MLIIGSSEIILVCDYIQSLFEQFNYFKLIFTSYMTEQYGFRTKNPSRWLQLRQNRQLMRQKGKENLAWQYISHFVTDVEMLLHCFKNYDNTSQQFFDQYIPLIPSIQLYEFNIMSSQAKITRSCLGRCGFSPLQSVVFQDAFMQQHPKEIQQGFLLFLLINNVRVHVDLAQHEFASEYHEIFDIINASRQSLIEQREHIYQYMFLEDNDPKKLKFQQEISEDIQCVNDLKNLLRFELQAFQGNQQQQLRIISVMEQVAFSFPSQTTFGWILSYLDKIKAFSEAVLAFDHDMILSLIQSQHLYDYYKQNLEKAIDTVNHYQINEQFPIPLTNQNLEMMPRRLKQYFLEQAKHLLFDHQKLAIYEPNFDIAKNTNVGSLIQYIYRNKNKIVHDKEQYYLQLINYIKDFYILDQMHIIVNLNALHLIELNSNDYIYKQLNSIFEDVQSLLKLTVSDTGRQVYLFQSENLDNFITSGILFINQLIEREKKYQFVVDKIQKVLSADKQLIQEQTDLFYCHPNNVMTTELRYQILQLLQALTDTFFNINGQAGRKQSLNTSIFSLLTSSEFIKLYQSKNSAKIINFDQLKLLLDDFHPNQTGNSIKQGEDLQVEVAKVQVTQKAPEFILSQIEQKWVKDDQVNVIGIDKFYPKANRHESEKGRKPTSNGNTQLSWLKREIGECRL